MFKHKVKEHFLHKIRQKDNDDYLYDAFFFFFFFFLTFYPISVYQFFKDHNGNKSIWMLFLCHPTHKLILDIAVVLF